jgi:hypothetical protein
MLKKPINTHFAQKFGLSFALRQFDGSNYVKAALYQRGFEDTSQKGQTWQT